MAIKVFWLSSIDPLEKHLSKTGTWIQSMYKELLSHEDIKVCGAVTFSKSDGFESKYYEEEQIKIYYVPRSGILKAGVPSARVKKYIIESIEEQHPDIIHIWGIENFWGTVFSEPILHKYRRLVDIQGFRSLCSDFFVAYGGLSNDDIKSMNKICERLFPKYSIENQRKKSEKWGVIEKQILKYFKYISTQSEWVRAILPSLKKGATIFETGIILRSKFLNSPTWDEKHYRTESPILFSIANNTPRKGLHVTLRAFKIIKERYPNAILKIAGMRKPSYSFFKGGYAGYIIRLIRELQIEDSVLFVGLVDEEKLLMYLYETDVYVTSSFIETYSLSLAEAIALGVPSVSSYSSALPELIENGKTGFLYPVGDSYMCAYQILKLLDDYNRSLVISRQASSWYRKNRNSEQIVNKQIDIYKRIMKGEEDEIL